MSLRIFSRSSNKPLPEGWSYVSAQGAPLMAYCPNGYYWYVTETGVERDAITSRDKNKLTFWPEELETVK